MSHRTCSIDGCVREVRARGWCGAHYERWRRKGTAARFTDLPRAVRFAEYVDSSPGDDSCHEWQARRNEAGYGVFNIDGERHLAHRWLLGHLRGTPLRWDDELKELACHHCDNPPCVNPAHLYIGDHATNQVDAYDRGLSVRVFGRTKTHCKRGHQFTSENTYQRPNGGRDCRRCKADAVARCYERNGRKG